MAIIDKVVAIIITRSSIISIIIIHTKRPIIEVVIMEMQEVRTVVPVVGLPHEKIRKI